jgi:hypothetical protein
LFAPPGFGIPLHPFVKLGKSSMMEADAVVAELVDAQR